MAVKMKGPANHGGFSFRGESFTPDQKGEIHVPHEALDEAFSHGFQIIVVESAPADGTDAAEADEAEAKAKAEAEARAAELAAEEESQAAAAAAEAAAEAEKAEEAQKKEKDEDDQSPDKPAGAKPAKHSKK